MQMEDINFLQTVQSANDDVSINIQVLLIFKAIIKVMPKGM